eukprot:PLAT3549.3.p1 GENE.PLAT3549.3~~PLAT3549.3.p1  ORF type:complete len:176 (+),score=52.29 PLAT3549.3:24-530(+)
MLPAAHCSALQLLQPESVHLCTSRPGAIVLRNLHAVATLLYLIVRQAFPGLPPGVDPADFPAAMHYDDDDDDDDGDDDDDDHYRHAATPHGDGDEHTEASSARARKRRLRNIRRLFKREAEISALLFDASHFESAVGELDAWLGAMVEKLQDWSTQLVAEVIEFGKRE